MSEPSFATASNTTRWGKRRRYQCQTCGKTFCSTSSPAGWVDQAGADVKGDLLIAGAFVASKNVLFALFATVGPVIFPIRGVRLAA